MPGRTNILNVLHLDEIFCTKYISIFHVDHKGMNLCFILRKYEWLKIFSTFRSSGLYFGGLYMGTTLEIIVRVSANGTR